MLSKCLLSNFLLSKSSPGHPSPIALEVLALTVLCVPLRDGKGPCMSRSRARTTRSDVWIYIPLYFTPDRANPPLHAGHVSWLWRHRLLAVVTAHASNLGESSVVAPACTSEVPWAGTSRACGRLACFGCNVVPHRPLECNKSRGSKLTFLPNTDKVPCSAVPRLCTKYPQSYWSGRNRAHTGGVPWTKKNCLSEIRPFWGGERH